MRTARLLTVSQYALLGGGVPAGGVPAWGGWVYLPRRCTRPGGVPAQGLYLPGGCTYRGVASQVSPPPVNRITDTCKNITLPQTSFAGGKKDW